VRYRTLCPHHPQPCPSGSPLPGPSPVTPRRIPPTHPYLSYHTVSHPSQHRPSGTTPLSQNPQRPPSETEKPLGGRRGPRTLKTSLSGTLSSGTTPSQQGCEPNPPCRRKVIGTKFLVVGTEFAPCGKPLGVGESDHRVATHTIHPSRHEKSHTARKSTQPNFRGCSIQRGRGKLRCA